MYQRFYKLATNPFRLAPEPDFCFGHAGFRHAREYLEFALAQGEGFVMVTGRPGTGKTMLVETFLKFADASQVVARRIAVSDYGAHDLLRAVAYAYGINAEGMDKGTLRHRIQQFFVEQERRGLRVLLIIDEAQTLSHAAIEELRILADLQTRSRLMLQLFLVGQPSLQDLMLSADMEQFQQRVIANYHLVPLNLKDTRAYIEHRLRQSGWRGDPEFSSTAVLGIYQLSKGVPRHINKVCNRLLLLGFGKGSHVIEDADVQEISVEMHEEHLAPLEIERAPRAEPDNVTNLNEVRDGLVSVSDLAIRADATAAVATAVPDAAHVRTPGSDVRLAPVDAPASNDMDDPSGDDKVARLGVTASASHAPHGNEAASPHASGNTATPGRRWRVALPLVVIGLLVITVTAGFIPSFPGHDLIRTRIAALSLPDQLAETIASIEAQLAALPPASGPVAGQSPAGQLPEPVTPVELSDDQLAAGRIDRTRPEAGEPAKRAAPPVQQDIELAAVPPLRTPVEDNAASRRQVAVVASEPPAGTSDKDSAARMPAESARVEILLIKGQQAMEDYRLVTPEEDNARAYFEAALAIDPANARAQAGLDRIVAIYVTLAGREAGNGELDRAQRYLDRAFGIQPDNANLLALQASVNSRLNASQVADSVPSNAEPPDIPVAAEPAVPVTTQIAVTPATGTLLRKREVADRRYDIGTARP